MFSSKISFERQLIIMDKIVFWDFYNTLGFCGNLYGKALKCVLDCYEPENGLSETDIKKCISGEFTWDNPYEDYRHLVDPDKWWEFTNPIFVKAYKAVGISEDKAVNYSKEVRKYVGDFNLYSLFPETIEALELLKKNGYTQYILSNFAPELVEVVEGLNIAHYFDKIIVSSLSGYEKPNPLFYKLGLTLAGSPKNAWMVGDSFEADFKGAIGAGLRAVLVRNRPDGHTGLFANDIKGAAEVIISTDLRYTE